MPSRTILHTNHRPRRRELSIDDELEHEREDAAEASGLGGEEAADSLRHGDSDGVYMGTHKPRKPLVKRIVYTAS